MTLRPRQRHASGLPDAPERKCLYCNGPMKSKNPRKRFCSVNCSTFHNFQRSIKETVFLTVRNEYLLIHLSRRRYALVDVADRDVVVGHRWCADALGYVYRKESDTRIRHGLYTEIVKPPAGMLVDHRNRNRLDNRRENLRVCTPLQNSCNHGRPPGASGFRGVTKEEEKYRAKICSKWGGRNGPRRLKRLGSYDTPEEAARAFDAAIKAKAGEFAMLNFPEEQ